ncbi:MAG: sulfur oxidation c-type cytochrome SoxX [Pseudomonadota bacterium]|nr:sulfur oxidation c-type cytochrome SoxX [Pseudomonadota bacterium]
MSKVGIFLAAAFVLPGTLAIAEDVSPDEVKFEDLAVAAPLTDVPGDPAAGQEVFRSRSLGNCLACHVNSDLKKDLFHGTVGPSMDGVADRWEPAQLRAIVANPKQVFGEQTVMPGFYSLDVGADVSEDVAGKTILTAQQVEDAVAYLATLKE